jgi:hypothetical protein
MDAEYWRMMGRLGAFTMHSRHNARETTAPARAAAWRRYEDMVDPGRVLDAEDRKARATAARRAELIRMSIRSQEVRRERRGAAGR